MIKILQGDAMAVMKSLPDKSVDMIFTDPPYGHNNNNNGDLIENREKALGKKSEYSQAQMKSRPIANDGAEANDLFRACLPEWKRLLKSGGSCCCCCCCGGGPDPQFARWSLWLDEVLEFKQMVVWDKGPIGMGWHYRRSYETVLVAMKPGAACKWYDETQQIENIIRPGYMNIAKIIPSKDDHPTPKPWQLAAHFIRLHTKPGEVVLDPFCGGGSTAQACVEMNRAFIGCDIDKAYVEMAISRCAQRNLFATTE